MTQAKLRFQSFEKYLNYDDGTDQRYELVDGELVKLPNGPTFPELRLMAEQVLRAGQ